MYQLCMQLRPLNFHLACHLWPLMRLIILHWLAKRALSHLGMMLLPFSGSPWNFMIFYVTGPFSFSNRLCSVNSTPLSRDFWLWVPPTNICFCGHSMIDLNLKQLPHWAYTKMPRCIWRFVLRWHIQIFLREAKLIINTQSWIIIES